MLGRGEERRGEVCWGADGPALWDAGLRAIGRVFWVFGFLVLLRIFGVGRVLSALMRIALFV